MQARPRTRLATPLAPLTAVLLALIPLLLLGVGVPRAHAAAFTVYNATTESWPHGDLEQFGATDAATVYDNWSLACSTTGCSNVPSQSTFEAKVQSYAGIDKSGASGPITLDFEGIVPVDATSTAQAAQEVALWKELITWAHDAEPNAPIGMYSYDYATAYTSYTAQLYASGYLDFFAPSLYNRWASVAAWKTELNAAVADDHAIDAALPIYPYVWQQWDNGGSGVLSGVDWDVEFQALQGAVQGAVLWTGEAALGSTACGWLGALSAEMGGLTGTASHGPLTLTATVPGGCELTRGATTDIPVTVTNNTASTTAATTLQGPTGPSGVGGTWQFYDIPALAPGGTWSTTLHAAVTSAETATTALLHLGYGTGDQRLAVLIP